MKPGSKKESKAGSVKSSSFAKDIMEGLGADTVVFQPSSPFGHFVYFCENVVLSHILVHQRVLLIGVEMGPFLTCAREFMSKAVECHRSFASSSSACSDDNVAKGSGSLYDKLDYIQSIYASEPVSTIRLSIRVFAVMISHQSPSIFFELIDKCFENIANGCPAAAKKDKSFKNISFVNMAPALREKMNSLKSIDSKLTFRLLNDDPLSSVFHLSFQQQQLKDLYNDVYANKNKDKGNETSLDINNYVIHVLTSGVSNIAGMYHPCLHFDKTSPKYMTRSGSQLFRKKHFIEDWDMDRDWNRDRDRKELYHTNTEENCDDNDRQQDRDFVYVWYFTNSIQSMDYYYCVSPEASYLPPCLGWKIIDNSGVLPVPFLQLKRQSTASNMHQLPDSDSFKELASSHTDTEINQETVKSRIILKRNRSKKVNIKPRLVTERKIDNTLSLGETVSSSKSGTSNISKDMDEVFMGQSRKSENNTFENEDRKDDDFVFSFHADQREALSQQINDARKKEEWIVVSDTASFCTGYKVEGDMEVMEDLEDIDVEPRILDIDTVFSNTWSLQALLREKKEDRKKASESEGSQNVENYIEAIIPNMHQPRLRSSVRVLGAQTASLDVEMYSPSVASFPKKIVYTVRLVLPDLLSNLSVAGISQKIIQQNQNINDYSDDCSSAGSIKDELKVGILNSVDAGILASSIKDDNNGDGDSDSGSGSDDSIGLGFESEEVDADDADNEDDENDEDEDEIDIEKSNSGTSSSVFISNAKALLFSRRELESTTVHTIRKDLPSLCNFHCELGKILSNFEVVDNLPEFPDPFNIGKNEDSMLASNQDVGFYLYSEHFSHEIGRDRKSGVDDVGFSRCISSLDNYFESIFGSIEHLNRLEYESQAPRHALLADIGRLIGSFVSNTDIGSVHSDLPCSTLPSNSLQGYPFLPCWSDFIPSIGLHLNVSIVMGLGVTKLDMKSDDDLLKVSFSKNVTNIDSFFSISCNFVRF